jgi:hypothetical protein
LTSTVIKSIPKWPKNSLIVRKTRQAIVAKDLARVKEEL